MWAPQHMESILWQLILNQATMQQYPQTSANFSSPATLDWLDTISESNAILSTILAIIHPQLYDAGWQTAKCLRNTCSQSNWYDMLVTLGRYWNCNLKLLGLGVSLEYGPSMVLGISESVLEHAAPCFEGDRVCYPYFMRNNMHEWMNVPVSDLKYTKYYE